MPADIASATRGELITLVYDLIEENNVLKIKLSELQEKINRLEENGKGKTRLPHFVKANVRSRKKVRAKRELNFARKRSVPDHKVFHSYEACPDCGGALGKPSVAYSREVIDIPLPKLEITKHTVFKRWCLNCHKRVSPKINLSGKTAGKERFGLNITSLVTVLNEEFHTPINKIKSLFKMVFSLTISEGEIVAMLQKAAQTGKPEFKKVKENLRASQVVYADETGARENGINGYSWNFSNEKYQLLLYMRKRNKSVVREFVGDENDASSFQGVMVSDFFASYNEYFGPHQRCWVHLLRDIKFLKESFNGKNPPVNVWAKKVKDIYIEAKAWKGPESTLLGIQIQERIEKENYFKNKLKAICEPYLVKASPVSTLSGRIIKFMPELFTFVRIPNISSDNNKSERDIRRFVIKRKISGGTRSPKGSQTREILGTLFGTWKLQHLNPFQETRLLLARAPCQEV